MAASAGGVQNPEIRAMAEQMASDPTFKAMTEQLQGMMVPGAAAGGAAGNAAGSSDRSAPAGGPAAAAAAMGNMDQAQYAEAMQKVLSNPQFAKMAEQIGQQMLQTDPQMQAMLETMKDPEAQQKMKEKMESLKDDPDVGPLITELETGGPAAMSKFWNDPVALEKLGKAFGGLGGLPPGFAARGVGADGVNDEDEEEEEEEDEDAPELHKAVQDADGSVEGVTKVIKAGGKGADGDDDEEEEEEEEDEGAPELHKAVQDADGSVEGVKVVTEARGGQDFNIDMKDSKGHTALHLACGYGEIEAIKVLLEHGASVTCCDKDKNTPLHYAAGYGIEEAVKILLDHGVGLTEKNNDGKTALEVAQMNEQHSIAKLLQDQEGDAFL